MADPVRIPITISLTRNCFTAQLTVGGGSVPANVLLDTGSSMAAVRNAAIFKVAPALRPRSPMSRTTALI
jgi:hypothetical protein